MTHPGLNWGCGPELAEGWENSDLLDYGGPSPRPYHIGDLLDGLPWPDETFDYVVANHSVQMLAYTQLEAGLAELSRVLKVGGVLRVLVPDLLRAMAAYDAGDAAWFPIVDEAETSIGGKLCAYATWYSTARTVFTPAWACELLDRAGFDAALGAVSFSPLGYRWPQITMLDSRPRESIVVEGMKRAPVPEPASVDA